MKNGEIRNDAGETRDFGPKPARRGVYGPAAMKARIGVISNVK